MDGIRGGVWDGARGEKSGGRGDDDAVAEVAGQQLPAKEYVIEGQTYLRPEADALEAAARQRGVGVPALRNVRGNNR